MQKPRGKKLKNEKKLIEKFLFTIENFLKLVSDKPEEIELEILDMQNKYVLLIHPGTQVCFVFGGGGAVIKSLQELAKAFSGRLKKLGVYKMVHIEVADESIEV